MIDDLVKCSKIPVSSLALVIALHLTPLDVRLPSVDQVGVPNFVAVGPVVFESHLVRDVELRLLWGVYGSERVLEGRFSCGVCKFHLVIDSPILGFLLQLIQTLAAWVRIVTLLKCPVELIFGIPLELGKLLPMHSKHLISELLSHVFDHLFDSPLLEGSLVEGDSVEAFESKSENASLTVFDSLLAISVRLKVFLEFLLFL